MNSPTALKRAVFGVIINLMSQAHNYLCLVLKTKHYRERDLLVTLVTREHGRIIVNAQGVRKLNSRKKAALEVGNLIHAQLVTTKNMPLLTQAQLVSDSIDVRQNLTSMRRFLLFLEILDRLLVSEQLDDELFDKIIYLRQLLIAGVNNNLVRQHFTEILRLLGFAYDGSQTLSITGQVNQILDSSLRSFDYLTVETTVNQQPANSH